MSGDRSSWVVIGVLAGLGIIFGLGWVGMYLLPRIVGFIGSGL